MLEGLKQLEVLLDPYDWFYEVCIENNRYVVYVNYMDGDQDNVVPDSMMGHQVLVHFAISKLVSRDQFVNDLSFALSMKRAEITDSVSDFLLLENVMDKLELDEQLSSLNKEYGPNIVNDIFFEIHDGKNAITNLSSRYPEVKSTMETIYHKYGFDMINDRLA